MMRPLNTIADSSTRCYKAPTGTTMHVSSLSLHLSYLIIKLIKNGKPDNQFTYEEIAPIYQGVFGKYFLRAQQENLTPLFYPYYFLKSDKFWHLAWTNAEVKTESPSRAWLDRNTQYAYIDQELWILLSHPTYRDKLKDYIIKEKVLKVFKEEKNKGGFKALLHLLMVI